MKEPGECLWCDRAWAILGVVAGMVIGYMGIDLWTGGKLTRMIRHAPVLASVTDITAAAVADDTTG